jgi:ribosomal protein S18 acetylase RimI-like enzyme
MDPLRLRPATAFSHRRLSELLNQAYADYYAPVTFDAYQFSMMCEDMDVDLARSVVAVAAGAATGWSTDTPIGMALLSVRGLEGWISGVGVLPEWRRRGVARTILEHILSEAQSSHLDPVRLEVLTQNKGGIRLYRTLGFKAVRDLLVLRLAPGAAPPARSEASDTESASPHKLLRYHTLFHDVDPSWQRALGSLQKRATWLQARALYYDAHLAGYVLYQMRTDVIHILDLAVAPGLADRQTVARTLLQSLHALQPDLGGYVVNVPAEDPLSAAFTGLGYRVQQRQHEMVWRGDAAQ